MRTACFVIGWIVTIPVRWLWIILILALIASVGVYRAFVESISPHEWDKSRLKRFNFVIDESCEIFDPNYPK